MPKGRILRPALKLLSEIGIKPESDLPLSGVTENGQFKINLWWDDELRSGQTAILRFDVLDTFLKDKPVAVPYDL